MRSGAFVLVLAGCGFHGSAGTDAPPAAAGDGPHADAPVTGDDAKVFADAPDAPGPTPPTFSGDWLIPCTTHPGGQDFCGAADTSTLQVVAGAPTDHWHATVHIRGVMANNIYQGGASSGTTGWYAGGTAQSSIYERFSLTVSSPPGVYYLNSGSPTSCCTNVFDYTAELDVDGGATMSLDAKSGDGLLWENKAGLTVAGVTTTPSPYDGQFAHLDLDAITPR